MNDIVEQNLCEILCPVEVEKLRYRIKGVDDDSCELTVYLRNCEPVWQPSDQRCIPPFIIQARDLCKKRNGTTDLFSEDEEICALIGKHVGVALHPGGGEYDDAFDEEIAYQAASLSVHRVDFARGVLPTFGATASFHLPFSVHAGTSEFQIDAAQLYLEHSVMVALRVLGQDKTRVGSLTVLKRIKKSLDIRTTKVLLDTFYTEPVKKRFEP